MDIFNICHIILYAYVYFPFISVLSFVFLLLLIRLCLCKFFQIMIAIIVSLFWGISSVNRYIIISHYFLSYDLFLKYDCHLYFALDDYVDFFLDMLMLCSTRNIITISFSWFYFDSTDAILLFNILLCCCQRISYFCCC